MIKKICLVLFLMIPGGWITNMHSGKIFALSENILGARILSINRTHNFLVIDIGTTEGISEGTNLNLLKDGESIAILQVIRAKEKVSACDIKQVKPNMVLKEGEVYSLTLSAGIPGSKQRVLKETVEKEKKESFFKKISPFGKEEKKATAPVIAVLPIMIHIEARKEIVNYYLNETLKDMNFIITSSDTKEGIFTAHKFLPISFWDEIWADFMGSSDHRAVYDINTIDDESGTTLKLDIRITYTTKDGRVKEKSVRRSSGATKDAVELVKRIKNMSEILTRER